MNEQEIEKYFVHIVENEADVSAGVAAIRTLMQIIRDYESNTVFGLNESLKIGIEIMKDSNYPAAAITSGSELFMRFITLVIADVQEFEECKNIMLKRGELFLQQLLESRGKIAKLARPFIREGSKILTHSHSRVVLQALKEAVDENINFEVFVTISSPDNSGNAFCKDLEKLNVTCTPILDSAVGYVMEQIDFVMIGAEAVMSDGGIVNKIGSYTMALCAKAINKPVYVLAESFKFTRYLPLNQKDLPDDYKYTKEARKGDLCKQHPLVDYTPPDYIDLLFTDLGILPTTAVSEVLINLYL